MAEIQLSEKQLAIKSFSQTVNGTYTMNQLQQTLGKNAGSFATSLVEIYTNDGMLQKCDPKKVVQEAIKAAAMKLPLSKGLGYAYILTFRDSKTQTTNPCMVIGYKGYIQLALRTGYYKHINCGKVYDGEYLGSNKLTGEINLNGSPVSNRIVGYFAYIQLNNGYAKSLYMTLEEAAKYALKYSPSFRGGKKTPPTVEELMNLAQYQEEHAPSGIGWTGDFNAMATKTVLRRLLMKYGYLSIEMMSAVESDPESKETTQEIRDAANTEDKPVFNAARVIEDANAEEIPNENNECPI